MNKKKSVATPRLDHKPSKKGFFLILRSTTCAI